MEKLLSGRKTQEVKGRRRRKEQLIRDKIRHMCLTAGRAVGRGEMIFEAIRQRKSY